MTIRILGNQTIVPSNTRTSKIKESNSTFADTLNSKIQHKHIIDLSHKNDTRPINTNPMYAQSGVIEDFMSYDEKQTLIEDKAVYDKYNLKEQGIEFGSKEWEEWKTTTGSGCIPRLNEPWQIRRAWRELYESAKTPEEKSKITEMKLLMFAGEYPQSNEQFNGKDRISNYLGYVRERIQFFKDVSILNLGSKYNEFVDILTKLEEKISNIIF